MNNETIKNDDYRDAYNKLNKLSFLKIALLFVIAKIVFGIVTFNVAPHQYGVVTRLGKISSVAENPGLYMRIPIIDNVKYVPKDMQIYDIKPSDVITRDKKSMIADNYIIWKVTDPVKFTQTLSASTRNAEDRVGVAVYNSVKTNISSMSQEELIEARNESLGPVITEDANSDVGGYGITIVKANIKALDLPDENKQAVYERMISERQNIAASFKAKGDSEAQKIKNDTDRQVKIMTAEAQKQAAIAEADGEAQYMKTLANAYNDESKADFYNFTRSLDSLKTSLKGSGEKTIILDKDSEIARILYGEGLR